MDENTQYEAIRKANAMSFQIGYPDELTDDDKLDEYYRDLELKSDSLFQNVLRIRKFQQWHEIKDFRKPIGYENDWRERAKRAAMVNAFNIPVHNTIRKWNFQSKLVSAKKKHSNK